MLVGGVRVPGVPVVKTDTSGDGISGGGGSIKHVLYAPLASCHAIIDLCLMLLPRAARETAGSKGLSDVAGQSCPAGAGSSALHPPHDQASASSGPRPHSHSA
jgi:hypothetical protein